MRIEMNSAYNPAPQNSHAARINEQHCQANFFNNVLLPELPVPSSAPGLGERVFNYVTGIPDFLGAFSAEACQGKLEEGSAKSLIKAVGKTGLIAVAGGVGLAGGILGGLAASSVGVVGGLALGGLFVLGVGPKVVDGAVDAGFSLLERIKGRITEWR